MNIEYNEKVYTISELAAEFGLSYHTLQKRLSRGWSLGEALATGKRQLRKTSPLKERTTKSLNPVEYTTWKGIISRCNNPRNKSYDNYGGRGITVCREWLDFDTFLSDMGKRPANTSIERINNNLGYTKENCKWATKKEQAINRRSVKLIEFQGQSKCIAEWAADLKGNTTTLNYRIREWGLELALSTPKGKYKGGRYLKLGEKKLKE
jgi:hypothetical protein